MLRKILFIFLIALTFSQAQNIKIFGDATVRPRFDANHNGAYGTSSDDFQYLYRIRLNIRSEIGDGWMMQTQLAHAGFGAFAFAGFERTEYRIPQSVDGALRPGVHFMQMYFGKESEKWSFTAGLIPVDGLENPLFDVHYYPSKIIDIPYALFSVNGAVGAKGHFWLAGNKLELMSLFDSNEGKYVEAPDGNELYNKHDTYTFFARYNIKAGEFVVSPQIMYAYADDSSAAPITYGAIVKTPEFAGFKVSLVLGASNQDNDGVTPYDIYYGRVRLDRKTGPGTITAWYDMAKRTDKTAAGDIEHDFNYVWLMYNFPIVSTDLGSITVAPTVRYGTDKADGVKDYSRLKAEVTVTYSFK